MIRGGIRVPMRCVRFHATTGDSCPVRIRLESKDGRTWSISGRDRAESKHTHPPPAPMKLKARPVLLEPAVIKQANDLLAKGYPSLARCSLCLGSRD